MKIGVPHPGSKFCVMNFDGQPMLLWLEEDGLHAEWESVSAAGRTIGHKTVTPYEELIPKAEKQVEMKF